MERDWKEAKPKWVVEAAQAEIATMTCRLALRWPDEARPTPLPFHWGDYDQLHGDAYEGTYYFVSGRSHVGSVEVRRKTPDDAGWKEWRFRENGRGDFTVSVVRGPLYETEREANLARLWEACDRAAENLAPAWDAVHKDRGFI